MRIDKHIKFVILTILTTYFDAVKTLTNYNERDNATDGRIIFQSSKFDSSRTQDFHQNEVSGQYNNDAIIKAIELMADAIEKMDLRLRKIEETLAKVDLIHLQQGTGNKLTSPSGSEGNRKHSTAGCQSNFMEVGNTCIYVSVYENKRANWQNAKEACEKMGSNLVEILTPSDHYSISDFLASSKIAAGYSFWIGALYPGAFWIWLSKGQNVNLENSFWTTAKLRANGQFSMVTPGDINNGRCLTFQYVSNEYTYKFAGDECGYRKFYLCQANKI